MDGSVLLTFYFVRTGFFMAEDYNGKETPELPTIHSSLWAKFHFIVTFYIFRVYYFENEYFYYFEISDANKE